LSYDSEEEQQYQIFISKTFNEPIPTPDHEEEMAV
jgi:hypothetical protein